MGHASRPTVGTREEWLVARERLLDDEKQHTRRADDLARRRRELPWVPVQKDYTFATADGPASLTDLFRGRSQLAVQHMMFPGCPSCASMADGYDGFAVHLEHHDVTMVKVSRYPLDALVAFNERMGWRVPYVSSAGSDFNYDYGVAWTDAEMAAGAAHNLHEHWDHSSIPAEEKVPPAEVPSAQEMPQDGQGVSFFALLDGIPHHTYSAYERGVDALWGMYQWLDRAPLGRNESGRWYRLHDEYDD